MYDFSTLPPHILTNVLSYLKFIDFRNAVQTCKSWYYASCDPKIINKLRVRNPSKTGSIEFLSRPITNLQLFYPNMNKFRYRDLFRDFGRTITNLELHVHISMPRLFELFIHLPHVKTLKLYDLSKFTSSFNFHRCRKIQRHHETIRNNIANIRHLTIQVSTRNLELYKIFLNNCKNIEKFSWNGSGVLALHQNDFINKYLLNPKEIHILENTIDLVIHNTDVHHKIFESLAHLNLAKLRTLSLSEISLNYYDVTFKDFCRTYCNLIEFGISSCNDQHLHDICRYMTKLKSIEIDKSNAENALCELKNLAQLEHLHVERRDPTIDDSLIELMNLRINNLKSLSLDKVTIDLLNAICVNCTDLDALILMSMYTHDCEAIFRYLVNLRILTLEFTEFLCHSSQIISSPVWNITKLTKLEDLFVDCYVPGITPELIKQLPHVNLDFLVDVYDPMDEEVALGSSEATTAQQTDEETSSEIDLGEFMSCNL